MAFVTAEEANQLANDSRCLACFIPKGLEGAAMISILNSQLETPLTPEELANEARCYFSCIPPGMQMAVIIYLLCQFIPEE